MTLRVRVLSVVSLTLLLWSGATAAFAHVGVETDNARPGAVGVLSVQVPNESETADTVRVAIQLPEGFEFVDGKGNKGWRVSGDGDNVVTIEGGTIPPGGERDFTIRVRNAGKAGEYAFPTIQSYSDGERVRWTGADGSDSPAPLLVVEGKPVRSGPATEPAEPPSPEPPSEPAPETPPAPPSPAATEEPGPSAGSSLPVALMLAGVGVAGAAIVLGRSRRRTGG